MGDLDFPDTDRHNIEDDRLDDYKAEESGDY